MTVNQEIAGFLKEGIEKGLRREQLEGVLIEAGWPLEQVRAGMAEFADVDFPIPVPRPKPYLSARETFVYLLLFSTLYAAALSLGSLLFALTDRAFPDPSLDPAVAIEISREVIRWSLSWLIVTFPVFIFVSARTERAVREDPSRRLSKIRRWLTYMTLFVGAAILIGVVTNVVYSLLAGEVTARFVLKVVTIAAITGSVLGYILRDLRNEGAAT